MLLSEGIKISRASRSRPSCSPVYYRLVGGRGEGRGGGGGGGAWRGDGNILTCPLSSGPLPFKTGHVSRDDLLRLAKDLCVQWKTLCRVLLDEQELDQIEHDEKSLYDKCYRVLLRWTQARGSHATYGNLAAALMHDALQLEDLVLKYCVI